MSSYPLDSFIMISIDNLDWLLGFARVHCGNQQSSWHGTTVQIVQPQPLGLTDPPHVQTGDHNPKRLHSALTPCTSPTKQSDTHSPMPKKLRRNRTGMEGKNGAKNSDTRVMLTSTQSGHIKDLVKPNLKLSDFQLNSADKGAI